MGGTGRYRQGWWVPWVAVEKLGPKSVLVEPASGADLFGQLVGRVEQPCELAENLVEPSWKKEGAFVEQVHVEVLTGDGSAQKAGEFVGKVPMTQ